jgi:hypothetical protein
MCCSPGGATIRAVIADDAVVRRGSKVVVLLVSGVVVGCLAACGGGSSPSSDGDALGKLSSASASFSGFDPSSSTAAGSGSSTPAVASRPPAAGTHPLGTPVSVTKPNGNAGSVDVLSITSGTKATFAGGKPPANGFFIIASVRITVPAGKAFVVNPLEFSVISSDGKTVDPSMGNAGTAVPSGTLDFQQAQGGSVVEGSIGFDATTAHGTLIFATDGAGTPVASWSY